MKVFISWAGETTKAVAEILREWIPLVIADCDPWVSSEDIAKGGRWSNEIASALQESGAGIICLTKENTQAPWLMFEAGALSKTVDRTLVCTYLFRIEPTEITQGPLTQFQHTMAERDDTLKLMKTLNAVNGTRKPVPESRVEQQFHRWWPELEGKLAAIPRGHGPQRPQRSLDEKVDEILLLLRDLTRVRATAADDISKIFSDATDPFTTLPVRSALFRLLSTMAPDAPPAAAVSPHVPRAESARASDGAGSFTPGSASPAPPDPPPAATR
jgi:hypothetical protein